MSELNEAPISPQEAVAYLAGQQDALKDEPLPVSDGDNLFGARAVNASQGYTEMTNLAHDVKEAELEPHAAAAEIAEGRDAIQRYRESTTHDIDRNYFINNDPSKPSPSNQVVSAEQAASDLGLARQQEAAELEKLESEQLAQAIDRLRGYDPAQQQAPVETPQQPANHPAEQQTPQADFDLAKEFEKNPRLLAAVTEYTAQAQQQADQIANYYRQAVAHNAEVAAAALVNQWPELKGLQTQDQFRTAIQTVSISNPQRAQAMVQHIEQTRAVIQEQQKAAAAHQQAEQQYRQLRWNHDAKLSDADFESWAATQDTPERVREIGTNAIELLKREGGVGEETIARIWNSDPLLRSALGQRLLYMASKYDLAQRGIQSKAHHPVPVVQRPGSPEAREPEAGYRQRQLASRLDGAKGNEALRLGAEMIMNRRNARR